MRWPVLRAGIDRLLASRRRECSLQFTGGEPVLAFPLIEKAVAYVERHVSDGQRVVFDLTTNGTLLRRRHLAFLAEKGFRLQVSFDGVPGAQDVRGRGTFARLDSLLDLIRDEDPSFFRCLRVAMTVNRDAFPWLADSVDYLLAKGVHEIALAPDLRPAMRWSASDVKTLRRQVGRVFASSLRHYRHTGQVPLLLFRKSLSEPAPALRRGPVCGAASGRRITVDVDGQVYACPMLAESFQAFPDTPLRQHLIEMRLGDVRDPALAPKLKGLHAAARRARIFYDKESKYSSYGRCARCRYVDVCSICPVPVARDPQHTDPDRLPDHLCAYKRVVLSHRARFPAQIDPLDVVSGRASFLSFLDQSGALRHEAQHLDRTLFGLVEGQPR